MYLPKQLKKKILFFLPIVLFSFKVQAYTYDISQQVVIHDFGFNFSRMGLSTAYYSVKDIPGHQIVDQMYKDHFWSVYPFWSRELYSEKSYSYLEVTGVIVATIGLMNQIAEGPLVILGSKLKNFNNNFPNADKLTNQGGLDMDLFNWRFAYGPKIGNSNYLKFGGQVYAGVHSATLNNSSSAKTNESGTLAAGLGIHYVRDFIDAVGRISIMYNRMSHHSMKELKGNQLSVECSYYCMEKLSASVFFSSVAMNKLEENGYLTKPDLKSSTIGIRLAYTFIPK